MIGRRGGELWVWAASVSEGTSMIHTATSAQRAHQKNRAFDPVELDGIVIWFDREIEIDEVRIWWTPFTGFDVTWPARLGSSGTPSVLS